MYVKGTGTYIFLKKNKTKIIIIINFQAETNKYKNCVQLTVATVVDKLFYQLDETDITLVIMMIESQPEKTLFVALLSGIFK